MDFKYACVEFVAEGQRVTVSVRPESTPEPARVGPPMPPGIDGPVAFSAVGESPAGPAVVGRLGDGQLLDKLVDAAPKVLALLRALGILAVVQPPPNRAF